MLFRPSAHLNLAYQVLHYVETHLEEPLTIRTISDEVGVSYFYLHHLFGETTGENLGQLIKRMRLEHAFGYLKHSGYTVGDIGDLMGFGSKHSFSRAFSNYFNQSPSKVRAQADLVIPDSFIQQNDRLPPGTRNWRQWLLDSPYVIQRQPPRSYFFQYLGPMAMDTSALFALRLRRLFEWQALLKLPLAFSTSAIGCATTSANAMIRAGFLTQSEHQRSGLKQAGFFQSQVAAGNYLMTRFEGALPTGNALTYALIQELVREEVFRLRDHTSLVLVEPGRFDEFQVWIPVA